jgi:peptidoglycan/LPS O-acetylase OafA/YrhL
LASSFANGRSDELWYSVYLSNWRDVAQQNRYIPHFWSLSIEEHFYIVWPLLGYLISTRFLQYLCLPLAAVAPILRFIAAMKGVSPYAIYETIPFRFEGLALGALLALAVRDISLRYRIRKTIPLAGAAAIVILVAVFLTTGSDYISRGMMAYGYTAVAILCGLSSFGESNPPARRGLLRSSCGCHGWWSPLSIVMVCTYGTYLLRSK